MTDNEMDNRIGWGVAETYDAVQEAMDERDALLRVVRAAEKFILHTAWEFDPNCCAPDEHDELQNALEALPEHLRGE